MRSLPRAPKLGPVRYSRAERGIEGEEDRGRERQRERDRGRERQRERDRGRERQSERDRARDTE